MPAWTPTEARTVVARAISRSGFIHHGPKIVLTTRRVTNDLAQWLEDRAGDMEPGDPRLTGFAAVIELLNPAVEEDALGPDVT